MRHGTSGRRQRNRSNGGNGGRRGNGSRMQVFDSNGPDVRIRGTAHQVTEKYAALAKDAMSVGNLILHQSYLQHAEHYQRIISALNEDVRAGQPQDKKEHKPRQTSQQEASQESKQDASDDLSLPSSILGETPEVGSSDKDTERTSELSEA